MLRQELILDLIKPVHSDQTIQEVLELMDEHKVAHLPWIDDEEYHGVISEEACLNILDEQLTIKKSGVVPIAVMIHESQHIFDAIQLFNDYKLSILPVMDAEDEYVGYLNPVEVIQNMGGMLSISTPGSVLVLRVNNNDFHLSRIAQIVESGDALVLMFYLTADPNSTQLEITIKLNRTDLSAIIQTFERYDFEVVARYHQSESELDLKFRYDNLMKYLNI